MIIGSFVISVIRSLEKYKLRKKAIPRPEQQDEWFIASLTPAAYSIFSDSFYQKSEKDDSIYVSINHHVKENPKAIKVRVMNGINPKTIKMMSPQIAEKCLDIQRAVSPLEFSKIKSAIEATY